MGSGRKEQAYVVSSSGMRNWVKVHKSPVEWRWGSPQSRRVDKLGSRVHFRARWVLLTEPRRTQGKLLSGMCGYWIQDEGSGMSREREIGGGRWAVLHYWSSSHGWWCLQGHLGHRIVAFVARRLTWQKYAPDSSSVCHLGHRQPGPSWCHSMGTMSIERSILKSTLHITYIQGSICVTCLHSGMGISWDKISLALVLPLTEVNSFVVLDPFLLFLFGNFTPAE